MDQAKINEIREAAHKAAVDVVKAQIAKGAPSKGMDKKRHVATVADVVAEMVGSFPKPEAEDDARWLRLLMRAALSGHLLNASQFRQALEHKDCAVLTKETAIDDEYGV